MQDSTWLLPAGIKGFCRQFAGALRIEPRQGQGKLGAQRQGEAAMRLIIRVFTALVITVVVLAGVLVLLPGEKVAALAADQLEKQTGRKLEFAGPVRFTLWPTLGVKADGVTLSNAEWAGPEPMLTAERLTIGIAAADLLRGGLRVTEVSAILPHLNLATDAAGKGNWVLEASAAGQAQDPGADAGPARTLAVEAVSLTGASFTYKPHGGEVVEMRRIDLSVAMPDPAGTVDLEMILRPAEVPVTVTGEIGTFSDFLAGKVSSAGVSVSTAGGMARFDGRADIGGEADGRLTLKADSTARMLAALGIAGLELPRGLGQKAVIGTDVTYTSDGQLALRDLSMDLDGNTLSGAADVVLAGVPKVTARLQGGDLVLPDTGGAAGGSGSGGDSPGWSKTPIDASALALANGSLDLSFASLDAGGVAIGHSALNLSLDRSRAVLKMAPLSVFSGMLQGQVVANNRNGFSTGGQVNFSGIRLEQALGQLADYDRLNGEALGAVEFLGAGGSVDAIMNSLSGNGWLEIGKGFFTGFDLEAVLRGGDGNGGSTVFDSLTGSYAIAGGNLTNRDLLIRLKSLQAAGAGRVGLGAQDLDYTLTVSAPGANGGRGLSVPVKITGPWADPSVRPDLEAAISDVAEAAAKEELRQKLQQELGTEIAPEADVEEVIKDELENRAKDSLLRLLGGD